MTVTDYKVVEANRVEDLNRKVKTLMDQGWTPVGSHQVVERHHQMRFSGLQHKDTVVESLYSQTMVKYAEQ